MGSLDGRVAIITGAGRGIGREHALLMASEGAKIVVNDLGGATDGTGADATPAQEVVAEIEAMGGEAIANGANVTDWEGVQGMINQAVEHFGDLHILVNNAGILRDRVVVNMTEAEWDGVIDVHMKGHFVPTRWAAAYWREQTKAGNEGSRSIVNTASGAMLGNLGQFNYAGAKAAIAAMTLVAAGELGRYGVKVNCLAPIARTRMTLATPGLEDVVKAPRGSAASTSGIRPTSRRWSPTCPPPIAPSPAVSSTSAATKSASTAVGRSTTNDIIATDGRWTVADLQAKATKLAEGPQGPGVGDHQHRRHVQAVREAGPDRLRPTRSVATGRGVGGADRVSPLRSLLRDQHVGAELPGQHALGHEAQDDGSPLADEVVRPPPTTGEGSGAEVQLPQAAHLVGRDLGRRWITLIDRVGE